MTKSTSKYRVSITSSTPQQKWRADAVARATKDRKARLAVVQQASLAAEAASKAAAASTAAASAAGASEGEGVKSRSNSISFVAPTLSTKRPAIEVQKDASIKKDASYEDCASLDKKGSSIPGTNRYNVSVDQIQSELDNLHKSSETIHKEIHSLNSIRNNLLWLLNKATHYETMRNHSLT